MSSRSDVLAHKAVYVGLNLERFGIRGVIVSDPGHVGATYLAIF